MFKHVIALALVVCSLTACRSDTVTTLSEIVVGNAREGRSVIIPRKGRPATLKIPKTDASIAPVDLRSCLKTRSVGPRASEKAVGKAAVQAYLIGGYDDAAQRRPRLSPTPPAAPCTHSPRPARSQDGVLRQLLTPACIEALLEHRKRQSAEKLEAGEKYQDNDLIFATNLPEAKLATEDFFRGQSHKQGALPFYLTKSSQEGARTLKYPP